MRGSSSILGTIHIFSTSTKFRLGMLNVGRGHISPRLSGVLSGLRRGIMVLGFVHNFTVGAWVLLVKAKNDLQRMRDFLDHI